MSEAVISAKGLGKKYRIGERFCRYRTLRESVSSLLSNLFRAKNTQTREIWALRDITFDVSEGEVVGIIGRNGAGKTTLLKILAQITYPTEGEAAIKGRVGSLLEVGTGFHPELTGRENIFLNGAILGMKRREIVKKFDEIVAFSGVEEFVDTPVKRYSSGMHMRLAFSVAAHLDPEILLVDEVLAVGDIEFQRKCVKKMGEVAQSGRTVLFVSHSMAAVESLCPRVILLKEGRLAADGDSSSIISRYYSESIGSRGIVDLSDSLITRAQGLVPVLREFRLIGGNGEALTSVAVGSDAIFEIAGRSESRLRGVSMIIQINALSGQRLTTFHTDYQYGKGISLQGDFVLKCQVNNFRLMPGTYQIVLIMKCDKGLVDQVEGLSLDVSAKDIYGTGKILPPRAGFYLPNVSWRVESRENAVEAM